MTDGTKSIGLLHVRQKAGRHGRLLAGRLVSLTICFLAVALSLQPFGCAAIRYTDYGMPAIRFDRPNNRPLPASENPAVQNAIATWQKLPPELRVRFPTPYHVYVNTPEPGTFEGDYTIGIAFSGGGTRGTVFTAECIRQLMDLGPICVDTPEGVKRVDLISEADYVTGVSTGAIPAALFALQFGDVCPDPFRFEQWPECFNVNVQGYFFRHLATRPDLVLRDMIFGMNTRRALAGAIAAGFFEGKPNRAASGLTFADLPSQPVVIIGATVISDPGVALMETRLPYRFALDQRLDYPWQVNIQSFESFHTDPLSYSLAEASHNSLSFPGHTRSGLLEVLPDRSWVYENLDLPTAERMRAARTQHGYEGTYDIKDGGLVDNRGAYILHRIYQGMATEHPPARKPLLIGLDAGYLELRPPKKGGGLLKKGWMNELLTAMRASWQTGQDAYNELAEATVAQGSYDYVRFRFTAWVPFMASEAEADGSPEGRYLLKLCQDEPLIQTPETLIGTLRQVGTTFSDLSPPQLAGTKLCARFAVWLEKDKLLRWASDVHAGAPASFAGQ